MASASGFPQSRSDTVSMHTAPSRPYHAEMGLPSMSGIMGQPTQSINIGDISQQDPNQQTASNFLGVNDNLGNAGAEDA